MLLYLSLVMSCTGGTCTTDGVPGRVPVPSIRLASERLTVTVQRQLRPASRPATRPTFGRVTKGMLVFAGVAAGMYAGAHLASAMDDSAEGNGFLLGMPIGGALGGLIVWQLAK